MIGVISLGGGGGYWQQQPSGEIININAQSGGVTAETGSGNVNSAMVVTNQGQVASAFITENTVTNEAAKLVVTNSPVIFLNAQYVNPDPAIGITCEYAVVSGGIFMQVSSVANDGVDVNLDLNNNRFDVSKHAGRPLFSVFTDPPGNNTHFYFENVNGAAGTFTGKQIRVADQSGTFIGHLNIFS